ncbi:MAG: hydroxylamine oxidation protein HaoB [Nitrospiraceae bacterium]
MIATPSVSVPVPSQSESKLLPSLGILLVTGGLFVLAWFAYLWLTPEPSPYRYQLVEEGGVSKFSALGLEAWPNLTISKYEVRVDSVEKPIAVAYRAAANGSAPVLLNWENRIPEPISAMGNLLTELTSVSTAIATHVPKDAIILSWWDTSRQIKLLAERDTLFTSHLGQPVITPGYWRGRLDAIDKYEREFWGSQAPAEETRKFQRFMEALIAYPNEGAAILRELAGPREAYVVVHVTDIYKLGLMRPERLDVAFKDFPLTGNVHGLSGQVKAWMMSNKYDTYTLQSLSEKEVRAYFLRESGGSNMLLARMLPFSKWRPLDLEALQLIHKEGGYWVYKIPSAEPS